MEINISCIWRFFMFYSIYYSIVNTIKASPRIIITLALAWFFISTSCGVLGLFASPNFFNSVMLILLAIAVAVAIFGFAKLAMWKKSGLRQTMPDGTVLLRLEHTLDEKTRSVLLANARKTTRTFMRQPIALPPAPGESQLVPVICSTCQQEITLRVAGLQARQKRRTQLALRSALGLVAAIVLELLDVIITHGQPATYPYGYVHFVSVVLLFISMIGFTRLVNYVGVTLAKSPAGHRLEQPQREDFGEPIMRVGIPA
jgi:hypothetical protein